MAIDTIINKINEATAIKENIKTAVNTKGVTIPDDAAFAEYPGYIDNIVAGEMQRKSVSLDANGTYQIQPDEGYDGLTAVDVSVNVPLPAGLIDGTISGHITTNESNVRAYGFYKCSKLEGVDGEHVQSVEENAFYDCIALTEVNFPACSRIGSIAFRRCNALTTVSLPACSHIGSIAFRSCNALLTVNLPACTRLEPSAFYDCNALTTVSLPACSYIGYQAFYYCTNLTSLYLLGSSVCQLVNTNTFYSTPMQYSNYAIGRYGSIYVPASLLTEYQTANNWSYYSSRFVGVET